MTYVARHVFVDDQSLVDVSVADGSATVSFSSSGSFSLHYPGRFSVYARAEYTVLVQDAGGEGPHGSTPNSRWRSETVVLPLVITVRTPDGQPFMADHVTMADIGRFRDLRGATQGTWTYSVHGQSSPIEVVGGDDRERVTPGLGQVWIAVEETVVSQSAAPLVSDTLVGMSGQRYGFDLFRVGMFHARTESSLPLSGERSMRLLDPDGVVVASSDHAELTYPVTLSTLDKSRDAQGYSRTWWLEVLPEAEVEPLWLGTRVVAEVIASARISTDVLQSRIETLLGPHGSYLCLYGEAQGSELLAQLKITDQVSAETIDMHHLLDPVLGAGTDIAAGVVYTLHRSTRDLGPDHDFHVSLNDVKVTSIDVSLGASEQIQPSIPALKVSIGVAGDATIKFGGFPLANASPASNPINVEAGVRLNADGSFSPEVWIAGALVDVHVSWEAAVAAGIVSFGLLSVGAEGVAELIGAALNSFARDTLQHSIEGVLGRVPRILEMLLGAEFTYRALRFDGRELVFDYVAPVEPEGKPYRDYVGIIGRSATQLGPQSWLIRPPLSDTWATDNLAKIDHVVVVMMENRSYDHVLGYLASPDPPASDGLSAELLSFLAVQGVFRRLRLSAITPNYFQLKTKFPASVGHALADVEQQLSERLEMPSGRWINSPHGFVANFMTHATGGLVPDDVLGYYGAEDLAFYAFLAENYAYCARSFCSHPGPTLPNRMFSLSGDVQYDRTGEAVLDNNNGDNFSLSRAQTIFDLLSRKSVTWRVYESPPSVTMLRMFARYAGDNTNIVPVSHLADDVAGRNLPAVTFIDPAMHSFPENDDHPPADMYNGQIFLKGIYDTLRSNEALWRKTALIITYDEHGGFFDHVIPPVAEARSRPLVFTDGGLTGPAPVTSSTMTTSYGLRVPTFVVSPWVPAGKGPDIILDHCSILKTVLARFCGDSRPFLTDRVHASRSFNAYLSAMEPRLDVPASPAMEPLPIGTQSRMFPGSAIDTEPMSSRKMRQGNVDAHELLGMLARMLGR